MSLCMAHTNDHPGEPSVVKDNYLWQLLFIRGDHLWQSCLMWGRFWWTISSMTAVCEQWSDIRNFKTNIVEFLAAILALVGQNGQTN